MLESELNAIERMMLNLDRSPYRSHGHINSFWRSVVRDEAGVNTERQSARDDHFRKLAVDDARRMRFSK